MSLTRGGRPKSPVSEAQRREAIRQRLEWSRMKPIEPPMLKPPAQPYVIVADHREWDVLWCGAMRKSIVSALSERH